MNTVPQLFDFHGNGVRVIMDGDEPWFVAKDVCDTLGIANPSQALTYLDDDERALTTNEGAPGLGKLAIVNESGLYSMILRSRKPAAKIFKKWITKEVIPAIRKTGSYTTQVQPQFQLPQNFAEALRMLADTTEELEAKSQALGTAHDVIEDLEPRAEAWDEFTSAEGGWDVNTTAQILNNIVPMGEGRLWRLLRDWGWVKPKVTGKPPRAFQDALNRRMLDLKVRPPHMRPNGYLHSSAPQILVTPKGLGEIATRLHLDKKKLRPPLVKVEGELGVAAFGEGAPGMPISLIDRLDNDRARPGPMSGL